MAIQIKRGTTNQIKSSEETLSSGQLLLNLETRELYAGLKNNDPIKELKPLTASNITNGTGASALNQVQDGTSGTIDFTNKNPNATAFDPTLTGQIPYGGTGAFATAVGGKAAAMGKRSFAAGTTVVAKGNYSAAFGDNSVTLGNESVAFGYATTAKGNQSATFGQATIAEAEASFAEGTGSTVKASIPTSSGSSGGEGSDTPITPSPDPDTWNPDDNIGNSAHVEGRGNISYGVGSHAENGFNVAYGHYSHAGGNNSTVGTIADGKLSGGYGSFAHATLSSVLGNNSAVFGYNNKLNSDTSFVAGKNNNVDANAESSAVFGSAHTVSKKNAFCAGDYNQIGGNCSSAIGRSNKVNGTVSFAQGSNHIIDSDNSFACGSNSGLYGNTSFAAGSENRVYGTMSAAIGYQNRIDGSVSACIGNNLKAPYDTQVVVGKYNAPSSTALFQVGSGTSDSSRATAFEVYNDGRASVQTAPKEDIDVLRKIDVTDGSITVSKAVQSNYAGAADIASVASYAAGDTRTPIKTHLDNLQSVADRFEESYKSGYRYNQVLQNNTIVIDLSSVPNVVDSSVFNVVVCVYDRAKGKYISGQLPVWCDGSDSVGYINTSGSTAVEITCTHDSANRVFTVAGPQTQTSGDYNYEVYYAYVVKMR